MGRRGKPTKCRMKETHLTVEEAKRCNAATERALYLFGWAYKEELPDDVAAAAALVFDRGMRRQLLGAHVTQP